jgi:uncharacterized protein YlxW (UPF0749 family)
MFVEGETDREIEFRIANKIPVTLEEVVAAVQESVGHSTSEAQNCYRRSIHRIRRKSPSEQLARQIKKMKVEKHNLHVEITNLQAQLNSEREANSHMKAAIEKARIKSARSPRRENGQPAAIA